MEAHSPLCSEAPRVVSDGAKCRAFEVRILGGEDAGGMRLTTEVRGPRMVPPWFRPPVCVTPPTPARQAHSPGFPPEPEVAVHPLLLGSRRLAHHTKQENRRLYRRACSARLCSLSGGSRGAHPRGCSGEGLFRGQVSSWGDSWILPDD